MSRIERPQLRRRAVLSGALGWGTALSWVGSTGVARAVELPQIVGCDTWGAKAPSSPVRVLANPPRKIIVHHTATKNVTDYSQSRAFALSRAIQTYHMNQGWIDSGQHFTVTRGAYVTEGRHRSLAALQHGGQHVEGAHCTGQNSVAIGIENEGTYVTEGPRAVQYEALVDLCAHVCRQYRLAAYQIYGHRDFNSTQCPGDRLYALLPQLRADVAARTGGSPVVPSWQPLRGGDSGERVRALQYLLVQHGEQLRVDGKFGSQTRRAVLAFQRRSETVVDGVAGAQTWRQLSVWLTRGSTGAAVVAVQRRLADFGLPVEADGRFGVRTWARVASFQSAHGLPADGVVDDRTWSGLLA
ncbi:N-acetylmuramoyl-L-alanine amidase [Streptomyces sp. NPDC006879]|uniref:peptidoglycan recognition protein family protein n=1 Tax=Streptomyces sp. NPDC006879 TaxID=3364767 RepID=UPI003689E059